jgi:MFS transporter, LAT3 family, solute carrier family 43, member 3
MMTDDSTSPTVKQSVRQESLLKRALWISKQTHHPYYAAGLYAFAFGTTCLSSGLVYGWPSLRRLLIQEGSTMDERTLGVIFTVGSITTQSCRFFYGIARDRWLGTKITACVSLLSAAVGSIGIALSNGDNGASLAISMFFVAMGSGSQLCLQPVAGLFDSSIQGAILASLSGAFQISGLVFVALTAISSNRKVVFSSFSAILFGLCLLAGFLLPLNQFVRIEKDVVHATEEEMPPIDDAAAGDNVGAVQQNEHDQPKSTQTMPNSNGDFVDDSKDPEKIVQLEEPLTPNAAPTAMELLKCTEYIWLVIWFTVNLVPLQYYIATIGFQLEQKGDDTGTYTRLFSIIYAASAIFSPFLGKFADVAGMGIAQAVATTTSAISLFLLSSYQISLNGHAVGMAFYGLGAY